MSLRSLLASLSSNSTHLVCVNKVTTPIGEAIAAADDDYLYILSFEDSNSLQKGLETISKELNCKYVENQNKILESVKAELSEYFKGHLKKFTVPVKLFGTEFQKSVWKQLLEVPYGSTITYSDLAMAIGLSKQHSRAVGGACKANPLVIVVPCHRIVGILNRGGFNAGTNRKDRLMELEKNIS